MQHFYDGQIRRFVTQFMRAFSNFSYKDGAGTLRKVPVSYGNLTRQVASIIKDNSENKVMSAPRIACYINGMEYARDRIQNPTFVDKMHVRTRDTDSAGDYLEDQGPGYTVERVMPVPFTLRMKTDIWSTNTDQKLQIMEQILVLFNPALEIQSTSNYVDWTSLSLIELANVSYSTRQIPQGVDTEIDVGELEFVIPIWITPPAKVKKLGVIEKIIMNIFDESGSINDGLIDATIPMATTTVSPGNFDLLVFNNVAKLIGGTEGVTDKQSGQGSSFTRTGDPISWYKLLDQYPGKFRAGVSSIRLTKSDGSEIVATASVNPTDENEMVLVIDTDTIPENTALTDSINTRGTVDAIIDPLKYNPHSNSLTTGKRFLILNDIHNNLKNDSSDSNMNAWQNADGSLFTAGQNDIITWNGTGWEITFDASGYGDGADSASSIPPVYITNIYTGIQYKYDDSTWTKSYEGEYEAEKWRLVL
jgi:hypothetical protein